MGGRGDAGMGGRGDGETRGWGGGGTRGSRDEVTRRLGDFYSASPYPQVPASRPHSPNAVAIAWMWVAVLPQQAPMSRAPASRARRAYPAITSGVPS